MSAEEKRKEILAKVEEYYQEVFENKEEFVAKDSRISYAGRVFDKTELVNLVDASLDFWLTYGRYSKEFEKNFCSILGVKYCFLVNSGSSANLVAFMALTSDKLAERRVKRGDEVITVAAGFPTTIAPIVQYGAVPVFVDVENTTHNIDVHKLEQALSEKTKAIMIAHTLGNPFDVAVIKAFCEKHKLWLIEDNCDALGSKYQGQYTGTFGDIATSSFYPPHHITMGEGGAVYTNNGQLSKIINSLRDWGKDCWCLPGKDNTCGKRFKWQLGELPQGYDHKYIFSHFGYNLKVTDMQAAIGCAQLEKLEEFTSKRQQNYKLLYEGLKDLEDDLQLPVATENSEPSWFGFMMCVKPEAKFTRDKIVQFLEDNNIQTRMLFAGNFIKHPCFDRLRQEGEGYRISGDLTNTNFVMENAFWVGVFPGMTGEMTEYMIKCIREFVAK